MLLNSYEEVLQVNAQQGVIAGDGSASDRVARALENISKSMAQLHVDVSALRRPS